jgi:NAD(P)-dependent dehydrogenase (short-subunit alcohol dehydrogenase family)
MIGQSAGQEPRYGMVRQGNQGECGYIITSSHHQLTQQSISPGYIRTALTAALLDAQPEFEEVWHRKKLLGRLATPDEMRGELI